VLQQFWSNSSLGFDFHQNNIPLRKAQGHYITTLLSAKVEAILRRGKKPLFLVVSHVAPGGSVSDMAVKEEDRFRAYIRNIEHEGRSKFAAVIKSLDAYVGRLVDNLYSAEILNNLVILFMSATGGRSPFD
ncbi:arylsulfatase J-like, partial [Tropilaelaps mercedesae]